ncbi:MAG: hypothetical protein NW223_01790 [Hyphomicrobiaceae bacterium]|nr:hypothetical protein [Hyphomicrobiaceae bacterium]
MPLSCRMTSWRALAIVALCAAALASQAAAQDSGWSPFKESPSRSHERRPPAREPVPADVPQGPSGSYQRPQPRTPTVERLDLDPVAAPDASGLPLELWRGLDLAGLERLLSSLELPPQSPTMFGLWKRMLMSQASPPAGAPPDHFLAVRLEALYRSGLLAEMGEAGGAQQGPVIAALMARRDIGLGDAEKGCGYIRSLTDPRSGLPERLRGEIQLLNGYCAARAGDRNAAGLAVSLAREEGLEAELPLAVLSGIAEDTKPRIALGKRALLLDYRFLELLGPVNARQLAERAEPALLAVIAGDQRADLSARIVAAEAGLRVNAVRPDAVADIYRLLPPGGADADPVLRRAQQFRLSEQAAAGPAVSSALGGVLREARRAGFGLQMAEVVAARFARSPPLGSDMVLAEIAAETLLAAGRVAEARQAAAPVPHWTALIDIVDPARKTWRPGSLAVIEELAVRGRMSPDALHRMATVLDALDIDVPVPLWDAANRSPQPNGGYLPETGALAELAQSAQRKETARTILLAMKALGPQGPDATHILPLGDTIRALRRVGLEADARRLALEALLPVWPRYGAAQ